MYPLDKKYWWRWPDANVSCKGNTYLDNYHAENMAVGSPLESEVGLFNTWHFSIFNAMFNRLKHSSRRTFDPSKASLFIIPYDLSLDGYLNAESCGNRVARKRCSPGFVGDVRTAIEKLPYFRRHEGRDHVLLWSLHEYHDIPWGGCDQLIKSFCVNCVLTCYWMNYSTPDHRYISIPFPSAYHYWDGIRRLPWQQSIPNQRNMTILYVGSVQTITPLNTKIRRAVSQQCEKNKECHWKRIFHRTTDDRVKNFIVYYRQAIFCLNPPGDDSARRGIFDSLLSGCIPVIFDYAGLYNQYPWHLNEQIALDVSVYIPGKQVVAGKLDVMQILLAIRPDVIEKKQRAIEVLASSLQYAIPPFHLLLNDSDTTPWEPPKPDAVSRALGGMFDRVNKVLKNVSTGIPHRLMSSQEWSQEYSAVKIQSPILSFTNNN